MIRRKLVLSVAIVSFTAVAFMPCYSDSLPGTGRGKPKPGAPVVENPSSHSLEKAFINLSDLLEIIENKELRTKCIDALGKLEEAVLSQRPLHDNKLTPEIKQLVDAVNKFNSAANALRQEFRLPPETPPEPEWALGLPTQVANEVTDALKKFMSKLPERPHGEAGKMTVKPDVPPKNDRPNGEKSGETGQQIAQKEVSSNRERSHLPAVLIVVVVVLGFTGLAVAGVFWKNALAEKIDGIAKPDSGKAPQREFLPQVRRPEPWKRVAMPESSGVQDLEKRLESHRQQLTGEVRSLFSLHVGEGKLDRIIELCEQLVRLMSVSQAVLQPDKQNPARFQAINGAMGQENREQTRQLDQAYRELGSIQGLCERILKQLPYAREALERQHIMLKDLRTTGDAIIRQGQEAKELTDQAHASIVSILRLSEEIYRRLPDARSAQEMHKELLEYLQPILTRTRKQDLELRNKGVRSYYVKLAEEVDRRIMVRGSVRDDENTVRKVSEISELLARLSEISPEDLKNVVGRAKEGADRCLQPSGPTVDLKTRIQSFSTITDADAMTERMLKEDTETLVNSESYKTFTIEGGWVSDMENAIVTGNESKFREDILEFLKTHHSTPGSSAASWLDRFQDEGFFRLLDHVEARMKIHGIHNEEVMQIIRSILDELDLKEMEIRPMQDTFDSRLHERGKTYPTERFGHNTVLGVMRIGILTKDGQIVKRKARVGVAMEQKI